MSKNTFRNIYIFCVYVLFSISNIAASDYYFKRISIEQGLSQPGVSSILRDYNGTLWVGTRLGLNRVDRNDIKIYFYNPADTTSISGNYINNLYEDSRHNLWIVTDGGLSLYNRDKDNFETILTNRIQAIKEVENGVLFGSYTAIYFYEYNSQKIERLPLKNNDTNTGIYKDYFISHLISINDTTLLAGTECDGIFTYNLKTHDFTPLITENTDPLKVLLFDKENKQIYFSAFYTGLFCYTLDGRLKRHYTTNNSGLTNNIILDIEEHDGKIWIGTDGGGIDILDIETDSFTNMQHIPGDINSLPVNSITVLYNDNKDNLWAGTVRDGVFLLKETYIKTYKDITLGSDKGLSEKVVISLFEDKEGYLWIGTDGGGINRFHPITETFTHHLATYGDKVVSMTDFSDNHLLISVYGKGVFIYDVKTQRSTPFIIVDQQTNAEECFSGFVPICHKISADKILILAKNAYMYNVKNRQFEKLRFAEGITNVHSLQLVYRDSDRSFMTKGNTIYTLENKEGIIRQLLELGENEYVNSVCYERSKNRLWIGSSAGLKFCDINSGNIENISTNIFDRISYMTLDNKDRLWINASNLLFSYDIKNHKFTIWDDSDGFLPNDVLTLYVKPSHGRYIYMGGSNGLVKIDKHIHYDDNEPVSFTLQEVEIDGRVYVGNIIKETQKLKVPENYSSLIVRVNLNEKDLFRRILFRYSINNKENHSVIESYSNVLNLTALAPGKYDIAVACMTKSGSWTEETSLITFQVMQPWYKRTWFILTAICSLIGIAVWLMVAAMKRNQRRLRWKMAMHQQELNEDKIQFLTNVSHELRTPLTLIYAPLKRLLERKEKTIEDPEVKKQIENVYRQANYMKGVINWILEYDRSTTLSDSLKLTFTDINELIRTIIADFKHEFLEKHIDIQLVLDDQIQPVEIDVTKIKVVIANILMNALKFSNPESTVTIRSKLEGDFYRIQVEDQGIGLKGVDTGKLFTRFYQGTHDRKGSGIGLAYCKELIQKHKGRIGAIDNVGSGAIIYFELPYKTSVNRVLDKFDDSESYNSLFVTEQSTELLNTSKYTVMIVDDNVEFLHYLESELKPLFKKIVKAKNGEEALTILKDNQPDILISDVMMPVMNGYQLCKEVKAKIEISHIPVILLTAKSDDDSQKIGYKLGADFYLSKPFDIDLLISVIRNQLKSKETIKHKYQQEIVPLAPEQATISNADEQFMLKLNKLIQENYSNPDFDVTNLIDQLAMSRASLYSKMKNITGLGLNEYINKYRIAAACTLLTDTDKPIADIAFETGFTSQRYFSTVFKQATGKTPSNYRTENKK